MLNPDNATLEWCAKWIEDSLRAETNERTIEFGKNMAMTIRAVKTKSATPAAPSAELGQQCELCEAPLPPRSMYCMHDACLDELRAALKEPVVRELTITPSAGLEEPK